MFLTFIAYDGITKKDRVYVARGTIARNRRQTKGGGAMHIFHWLVTLFFSGTAVSLLSYQAFEIVQAFIDFLVDRHS
ncbi:hypothetical protein SAMN05192569_101114 [Parageobacillus thermantarcticus]|uniref:Uncharacterized protein n=1 Tax=Parageobacillus thermantarcticus TaxID=186116 RepID=A0A1I0T4Y2_9BACL|nr:hypothetical protein [Parageobacillus thermantarcticus]SFA46086.1 hypothetical protein SAMN05192569_101114 [Parageobacillus thermantarcticus]